MVGDASPPRRFLRRLADELTTTAVEELRGLYLHGSAVLGDWSPTTSDVDVLVVVRDQPGPAAMTALAAALGSVTDCPGVGLEASVVEAHAAAVPAEPWPFVVHVTTAPDDRKTVWGAEHGGDPDLILHYAVVREFGWAAEGPDPAEVFGSVPRRTILRQLGEELRWAVERASESYAVLNACRALRYRDEQVLCSKTEAGEWALTRQIAPSLVGEALEERRLALRTPVGPEAAKWVTSVSRHLSQ